MATLVRKDVDIEDDGLSPILEVWGRDTDQKKGWVSTNIITDPVEQVVNDVNNNLSSDIDQLTLDLSNLNSDFLARVDEVDQLIYDIRNVDIPNLRSQLEDADITLQDNIDAANTSISSVNNDLQDVKTTTIPSIKNQADEIENRLDLAPGSTNQYSGISVLNDNILIAVGKLESDPLAPDQFSSIKLTNEQITNTVAKLEAAPDALNQFSSIKQTKDLIDSTVASFKNVEIQSGSVSSSTVSDTANDSVTDTNADFLQEDLANGIVGVVPGDAIIIDRADGTAEVHTIQAVDTTTIEVVDWEIQPTSNDNYRVTATHILDASKIKQADDNITLLVATNPSLLENSFDFAQISINADQIQLQVIKQESTLLFEGTVESSTTTSITDTTKDFQQLNNDGTVNLNKHLFKNDVVEVILSDGTQELRFIDTVATDTLTVTEAFSEDITGQSYKAFASLLQNSRINQTADEITLEVVDNSDRIDTNIVNITINADEIDSTVATLNSDPLATDQFSSIVQTAQEIDSVVATLNSSPGDINQFSSIKQSAQEIDSTVASFKNIVIRTGLVDSSTSTSITDNSATFLNEDLANDIVGVTDIDTIIIHFADGQTEVQDITNVTSTTIEVSGWTKTPAIDDEYKITATSILSASQIKQADDRISLIVTNNSSLLDTSFDFAQIDVNKDEITSVVGTLNSAADASSQFTSIKQTSQAILSTAQDFKNILIRTGTPSSSTNDTLTDTSKNFLNEDLANDIVSVVVGDNIILTKANGDIDSKSIIGVTSDTITIDGTWTSNPTTDDSYKINSIDIFSASLIKQTSTDIDLLVTANPDLTSITYDFGRISINKDEIASTVATISQVDSIAELSVSYTGASITSIDVDFLNTDLIIGDKLLIVDNIDPTNVTILTVAADILATTTATSISVESVDLVASAGSGVKIEGSYEFSKILQNEDNISLNVTDIGTNADNIASLDIRATDLESTIVLKTDTDGNIALFDMSSTSNGSVIDIKADQLNIDATTTFASGFDPSTKETPSGAQSKADTAETNAQSYTDNQLAAGIQPLSAVIRSNSEPTTRSDSSALKVGDRWIDTDDGDAPYSWNGSSWIRSFTRIDGGLIKTGVVDAARIDVQGVITTGSIIVGGDNVSNLTNDAGFTNFDSTDVETAIENDVTAIDGSKLVTGSIFADKININDLEALNATIGNWDISTNTISSIDGSGSGLEFTNDPRPLIIMAKDASNRFIIDPFGTQPPTGGVVSTQQHTDLINVDDWETTTIYDFTSTVVANEILNVRITIDPNSTDTSKITSYTGIATLQGKVNSGDLWTTLIEQKIQSTNTPDNGHPTREFLINSDIGNYNFFRLSIFHKGVSQANTNLSDGPIDDFSANFTIDWEVFESTTLVGTSGIISRVSSFQNFETKKLGVGSIGSSISASSSGSESVGRWTDILEKPFTTLGTALSVDSSDNLNVTLNPFSTANLSEDPSNLYHTAQRVKDVVRGSSTFQTLGTGDSPSFPNITVTNAIKDTTTNIIETDGQGNVVLPGNLTVKGDTVELNVTQSTTEDPLVLLADGNTSTALDIGYIFQRGGLNSGVIFDESSDEIATIFTNDDGTTSGNVTIDSYTPMRTGHLRANSLNIGGTEVIDTNQNASFAGGTFNGDVSMQALTATSGAFSGVLSSDSLDIGGSKVIDLSRNLININDITSGNNIFSITGDRVTYDFDGFTLETQNEAGVVVPHIEMTTGMAFGDSSVSRMQFLNYDEYLIRDGNLRITDGFINVGGSLFVDNQRNVTAGSGAFSGNVTSTDGGFIANETDGSWFDANVTNDSDSQIFRAKDSNGNIVGSITSRSFDGSQGGWLELGNGWRSGTDWLPSSDIQKDLGSGSLRWKDAFIGNDLRVDGEAFLTRAEIGTLRTTLFKPQSINGLGGEFTFSAVTKVASIDTTNNDIVVDDAVLSNGDKIVVSSSTFDNAGFVKVELNITSTGATVSGGIQYSYTVNAGLDTDIQKGFTVVRADGDLIYVNATEGSGSPSIKAYDNITAFAESPLSGGSASPVWELNPTGGLIANFEFDGAKFWGGGTAGEITGMQSGGGTTRTFFAGSQTIDGSDANGVPPNFFVQADGNIFHPAIGKIAFTPVNTTNFTENDQADALGTNKHKVRNTQIDDGASKEKRNVIITTQQKDFSANQLKMGGFMRVSVESNETADKAEGIGRIRLFVDDLEGANSNSSVIHTIDGISNNDTSGMIPFTGSIDVSMIPDNHVYRITVEAEAETIVGTDPDILTYDTLVELREDVIIRDSTN